jgi:hypothetical protein
LSRLSCLEGGFDLWLGDKGIVSGRTSTSTYILTGLRVEDRIAGASNWSSWKAMIVLIVEERELWDIVENLVVPPIDAVLMVEFHKRNIGAKRTILDAVKDHVIPHVSGKDFTFQMW